MKSRIALILALLLLSTGMMACHRKPPRDASVIKESEMQMDSVKKSKRVGGGGRQLNENQW